MALILLLTVIAYTACWIVYQKRFSSLATIPNAHFSSPIAAIWISWIRYTGRENQTVAALHESLGSVIRLAPDEISVIGETIKHTRDYKKEPTYYTRFIKHE